MTKQEIREHIALRESDPLSLRPDGVDESWGVPSDEPKTLPSPVALAFITASHEEPCDCLHCAVCR